MYGLCIAHITSPAEGRMRSRTAREQYEAAQRELNRGQDESIPDEEDDMSLRNNVLT